MDVGFNLKSTALLISCRQEGNVTKHHNQLINRLAGALLWRKIAEYKFDALVRNWKDGRNLLIEARQHPKERRAVLRYANRLASCTTTDSLTFPEEKIDLAVLLLKGRRQTCRTCWHRYTLVLWFERQEARRDIHLAIVEGQLGCQENQCQSCLELRGHCSHSGKPLVHQTSEDVVLSNVFGRRENLDYKRRADTMARNGARLEMPEADCSVDFWQSSEGQSALLRVIPLSILVLESSDTLVFVEVKWNAACEFPHDARSRPQPDRRNLDIGYHGQRREKTVCVDL